MSAGQDHCDPPANATARRYRTDRHESAPQMIAQPRARRAMRRWLSGVTSSLRLGSGVRGYLSGRLMNPGGARRSCVRVGARWITQCRPDRETRRAPLRAQAGQAKQRGRGWLRAVVAVGVMSGPSATSTMRTCRSNDRWSADSDPFEQRTSDDVWSGAAAALRSAARWSVFLGCGPPRSWR
jgi:hypothetical protein